LGFRNLRDALGQRVEHEKPRVATEEDIGFMRIQLRVRNARIGELEKEVNELREALGRPREQIGGVNSDIAFLNDTVATLTAAVAEREARIAALKSKQVAGSETLAAGQNELARATAELEAQRKNLGTLEAALAAANTRLTEEEAAALAALELRKSMEAAIEEQHQRILRLEVDLAAAVHDRDASVAAAAAVQAESTEQAARLATASARVLELEAEALAQARPGADLPEEARVSLQRGRAPTSGSRPTEDSAHRFEIEAGTKSSTLDKPLTHDDTRGLNGTREVTSEGAAPLFIRTGDSEVVHVLGPRTTIGRTRENDLQIDAKYISRHHAVILAGPTQTVIEDLNSTNGVIVNGRRILRQTLKDGDIVLIGAEPFRYAERPMSEQR
jgi:DNA repair exonuclease SbcCD ATPase subunit